MPQPFNAWEPLDHLSHSSLNQLARCPQQWFWSRLMNKKEPPSGALHVGRSGHAALEYANKFYVEEGHFPKLETVQYVLDQHWKDDKETFAREGWDLKWRDEKEEVIQRQTHLLFDTYFRNPLIPKAVESYHEIDLQKMFGTAYIKKFVGYIDIVTEAGDVADYKFSTRKKNGNDVNIDLQPFAYSFLLDRPVDFCFVEMLRPKTSVKDPYGNIRVERTWTKRTEQDINWYTEQLLPGLLYSVEVVLGHIYEEWGDDLSWREDPETVSVVQRMFPATPNWACNSFCAYRREGMCELRL